MEEIENRVAKAEWETEFAQGKNGTIIATAYVFRRFLPVSEL